MSLNIKNDEAHELAGKLANLTGKSMTAAVLDALRAQLSQLNRQQESEILLQELMMIGQRCAAHLQQHVPAMQHGEILYDKSGLPG